VGWIKRLAGMALLCLLIFGCGESTRIEWHEPGEYQGRIDPLLDKAGTPEQNQRLQERLLQVQTDR